MMSLGIETRRQEAKNEFENIIRNYMLPLFDVRGNLKCKNSRSKNSELIAIKTDANGNSTICFYPCIGTETPSPFYCEIGIYSSKALKKPAIRILRELLKVTEYGQNASRGL